MLRAADLTPELVDAATEALLMSHRKFSETRLEAMRFTDQLAAGAGGDPKTIGCGSDVDLFFCVVECPQFLGASPLGPASVPSIRYGARDAMILGWRGLRRAMSGSNGFERPCATAARSTSRQGASLVQFASAQARTEQVEPWCRPGLFVRFYFTHPRTPIPVAS